VLSDGLGPQETRLAAVNRRGRPMQVRIVCSPLVGIGPDPTGAILVIEPEELNPQVG